MLSINVARRLHHAATRFKQPSRISTTAFRRRATETGWLGDRPEGSGTAGNRRRQRMDVAAYGTLRWAMWKQSGAQERALVHCRNRSGTRIAPSSSQLAVGDDQVAIERPAGGRAPVNLGSPRETRES